MKTFEFNGKVGTIEELAAIAGINSRTVRSRLERGKTLKEALTEKVSNRGRRTPSQRYIIDGKEYRNLAEVGAEVGLTSQAIRYRMNKKGMTLEEAIDTPPYYRDDTVEYTVNGVKDSIPNLCRRFGTSYPTAWQKLRDGVPPEMVFKTRRCGANC